MKEDAAAKELEDLLRDALETGIGAPSSRQAARAQQQMGQMRTVPLPFKPGPSKPLVTTGRRIDVGLAAIANEEDDDEPRLNADAFASAPEPEQKKSRLGLFAVLAVAVLGLGAGGYAWKLQHRAAAQAAAAAAVVSPAPAVTEGAVGFSVASRPAMPAATDPKPEDPVGAATIAKAEVILKPEPAPVAPPPVFAAAPRPVSTAPVVAAAPRPESKPAYVRPEPPPRPEPKPVVAAARPEPAPAPRPAPAAPQPAAGSVDALLQQQLKGAIP